MFTLRSEEQVRRGISKRGLKITLFALSVVGFGGGALEALAAITGVQPVEQSKYSNGSSLSLSLSRSSLLNRSGSSESDVRTVTAVTVTNIGLTACETVTIDYFNRSKGTNNTPKSTDVGGVRGDCILKFSGDSSNPALEPGGLVTGCSGDTPFANCIATCDSSNSPETFADSTGFVNVSIPLDNLVPQCKVNVFVDVYYTDDHGKLRSVSSPTARSLVH
jgi:hypothetical protein